MNEGPVGAGTESSPRKRTWIWLLVVGSLVALPLLSCACLAAGIYAMRPSDEEKAAAKAAVKRELDERIASDFPGWKVIGSHLDVFPSPLGTKVGATYGLVPPGRDFPLGVMYSADRGEPIVLLDEVLHEGARFQDRSGSLLDYLDENYDDRGRGVSLVTSYTSGEVYVGWNEGGGKTFSVGHSKQDLLTFNVQNGEWSRK